jgi:hypothetical protein
MLVRSHPAPSPGAQIWTPIFGQLVWLGVPEPWRATREDAFSQSRALVAADADKLGRYLEALWKAAPDGTSSG